MDPRAWISQLTFSDDSVIDLGSSDVVVIVGSNNAGKSAALRAVRDKLATNAPSPVIKAIGLGREGTSADVVGWLESFTLGNYQQPTNPVYQGLGVGVHRSQIDGWWPSSPTTMLHSL